MKNKNYFSKFFVNIILGLSLSLVCFVVYGNSRDMAQSAVNDAAITTAIKAKYINNSMLSVFDIHVETTHGIVQLSGLIDSDAQYERAIIIAENTDGVRDVQVSNLKIKSSNQPLADTVITAKIKGLLLKDKLVNDELAANLWPIHIETKDGIVFITGSVKTALQKEQVIKTAKLVDGVKSVKADLQPKN